MAAETTIEKKSVKLKLFIGLIFALLAIISISIIAYNSVSNLVDALSESSKPNNKLILLKSIMSDLSDAESSVRTFTITNDASYLTPYQDAVFSIEDKMQQLFLMNSDEAQRERLDSIDRLIKRKYEVLNELLHLSQNDRVEAVLGKITNNIAVKENEAADEAEKQKLSLLKELFGSNKDKANPQLEDLAEIQQMVTKIKQEESKKAEQQKQKEFELTKKDVAIMISIRSKLNEIESVEIAYAQARARKAEKLANLATVIITVISVSALLLVLSLAYVIFSFISRVIGYNKKLQTAKEHAEKLAKVKEEFLANMSHEIRTPMNSILGFSEQLEKTPLSTVQKDYIDTIKNSTEHLLVVVNDILDHSKLESGKFTFEKVGFRPAKVFRDVYDSFGKIASEKKLNFKLEINQDVPEILKGDPHRLKQILYNLVGNAFKFTEKGEVKMNVSSIRHDNDKVDLKTEVADTGIGISAEKLQSIFSDFYQADSSNTRKYGGTGLGLTITKKLVELQGGKIEVNSEKDKGSTFSFNISYTVGEQSDVENETKMPEDPEKWMRGFRVLVVDDEKYNLLLLKSILERWGMKVSLCESGLEALKEMENADYNLVLMDVRMPELNGLETTRRIREMNEGNKADIPVLALTAASSEQDIKNCKEAGMNDFLTKPFREAELFEKISAVLKNDLPPVTGSSVNKAEKFSGNGNETLYDLSELKRLANGDEKFVEQMIRVFIDNTGQSMIEMKEAVTKQNWQKAGLFAHRLAAPSRHLGMNEIVRKLKEIENIALNNTGVEAIPSIFESLNSEMEVALDQLREENF